MAHTITVLNQRQVPGIGLITVGTVNVSGAYATGGEDATTSLQAKLQGRTQIDSIQFGFDDGYTAFWDGTNEKIRIFKLASGVPTERADAAAYDANVAIPFTCISR